MNQTNHLKDSQHLLIEEEIRKISQEYKLDSTEVIRTNKGYYVWLVKAGRECGFELYSVILNNSTALSSYIRDQFNKHCYAWISER